MIDGATAAYGVVLLRWSLGSLFVAHAIYKWRVDTIPGTMQFFESLGLPGWLGIATIGIELTGAACLILGIYSRFAALLLVPVMIGTIVTVHGKNGWRFTNKGGGWEYPAFWTAALLAVFLIGDGTATLVASPSLSALL